MALENFLVVLKESVPPQATDRVVSTIKNIGGTVEVIIGEGKVIIATFDNSFADEMRRLPYVKVVGGVTIRERKLPQMPILRQ